MRISLPALTVLAPLIAVATPALSEQGSTSVLTTSSYVINIRVLCEEGVVDCNDVEYVGENKRSGARVQLKGEDWIRYCQDDQGDGPGRTPCEHLGYKFKNGTTSYYVGDDGDLEVFQGKKRLLHEKGEWDWAR